MLQLLSSSPNSQNFESCINSLLEESFKTNLVLYQDAVYASKQHSSSFSKLLEKSNTTVFAISEDFEIRGITIKDLSKIKTITYEELVTLTLKNSPIVTW